jgi:hypothetical protein
LLNKEVKVILDLVRMKVNAARPKVATAAKAAAAKVPSKAVIKKPATTTKNSAKATVTELKPGQKVKVTVNVRPKA